MGVATGVVVGSGVGMGVETGVDVGSTVGSPTTVAVAVTVAVGPGSLEQAQTNATIRPSSPHSRANRSRFEGQYLLGPVYGQGVEDVGPCIVDHHLGTHGIIANSCSSN